TGTTTAIASPTQFLFCDSLSLPALIPDDDATGINNTINVADARVIQDLNVRLNVTHPFVGDLRVRLTHVETGTTVTLIDRPGVPASSFGCNGGDMAGTFDDQAASAAEDACEAPSPALSSRLEPLTPLSAFNGQSLAGAWRLNLADLSVVDSGSLLGWCLE